MEESKMKKSFKIIISAIAVIAMASCSKEVATQNGDTVITNPVEYTLAVNAGTKAELVDGKKVQWCAGDKIAVFAQDGTKFELTVVESTIEGGQATFSGQITEGAEIVAAVAPAAAATSFADGTVTITIPASQTIAEGAVVDPAALVMSGEVSGASAELHNAVALLKFTPAAAATKFHFGGVGVEKIAGAATATLGEEAVAATTGAAEVIVSGNFASGKAYYAAIAPASFTKGIAVAIESSAILAKSTDKSITIARNDIADLGSVSALSPISDAAGLFTLARCVNALSVAGWNEELGSNIDLGGATWTPIGNGTYQNATTVNGATFQGAFDGKNFTIDNLTSTCTKTQGMNGVFGIVRGSVKNLKVGSKAKFTTSAGNTAYTGAVAAYLMTGSIENCQSSAQITVSKGADDKRTIVGGIVGLTIAQAEDVLVKNCTLNADAKMSVSNTVNTKNGASGFHVGGIVGLTDNNGGATFSVVDGCTNNASFEVQAGRLGGVIGTCNKSTKAKDCVNNGNITTKETKSGGTRLGGVAGYIGANASLTGCKNVGTIAENTTKTCYVGGVLGHAQDATSVVDACENYGTVKSDTFTVTDAAKRFIGSILAIVNNNGVTVKNCKVGGKIGSTDESTLVTITADNYTTYMVYCQNGKTLSADSTGNVFAE